MLTLPDQTRAAPAPALPELAAIPFAAIPRTDWDRLFAATPSASPFSRWNVHRAWWDAYGDTAHEQYLVLRDSSPEGAIRAIVPLMHRHAQEPLDQAEHTMLRPSAHESEPLPADYKVLYFGASYHADYATILAAPADLPMVAAALADYLAGPPDPAHGSQPWGAIDLRRLRSDDRALACLDDALSANRDWRVTREREDVCPVVTVPSADWDEYLATLDKKDRHEIRRKLRRAAVVGDLSVEVSPPTPDAIEAFIRLHDARFGEDGLFPNNAGGERSRAFVHRLAELELAEPDGGQMHVGLVRCGKRLIYAVVAFDDGSTCYLYNAGMDPAAAEVSPGVSGTASYLRDRMAVGRNRFDFLRGAEPYKYEWGARDDFIERIVVRRGAGA